MHELEWITFLIVMWVWDLQMNFEFYVLKFRVVTKIHSCQNKENTCICVFCVFAFSWKEIIKLFVLGVLCGK
jgi:hypothetical protein